MARPRSRWIRTCTLALVAGAGLFGGCQKIFGEYEVVPEPPVTYCVATDKRCVGPFLYVCGPDLDSWVYRESCRSEAHCASREGGCLKCAPGEHRCSGGVLEVCGDDGFTLAEDCGDANRCNLNSDSCRPCTEGEYQCNQGNLMQCMPGQVWQVTECASEAACSVGPDKRAGACIDEPACAARTHVCDGAKLMHCTEDGQQLVDVDTCESPGELCDAAAADEQAANNLLGTCLEACEPGANRCVEAELQHCSAESKWQAMTTCASANLCSAKGGSAGCLTEPCAAGSLECNDGELRRCTDAGWDLVQDCGVAALCNDTAGKCEAAACPSAGETRCDRGLLQECSPDQAKWKDVVLCNGDSCNANDGDCDPVVCTEDARRCWNNTLETCSSSLLGWDVVEVCEAGETCSLDGCSASPCTDGDRRCNDVYLETCVGTAWEHVDRCATPALCDPSQPLCDPPACEAGKIACDGASVKRCLPDRTDYEVLVTCGGAEVCDASVGNCVPAP